MKQSASMPLNLLCLLVAMPLAIQLLCFGYGLYCYSRIADLNDKISVNYDRATSISLLKSLCLEAFIASAIPETNIRQLGGISKIPELHREANATLEDMKQGRFTGQQESSFSDLWRNFQKAQQLESDSLPASRAAMDKLVEECRVVVRDLNKQRAQFLAERSAHEQSLLGGLAACLAAVSVSLITGYLRYDKVVSQPVRSACSRLTESLSGESGVVPQETELERLGALSQRLMSEVYELRFREVSLAANSKQIILSLDKNARVRKANPFSIDFFQLGKGDSTQSLTDRLGADGDYFQQTLSDMNEQEESLRKVEMSVKDGSGRLRDLEWTIAWSKSDESFFCVANDVTATRQADRFKDEMLATLSHDIRSPLSACIATLERITRLRDDDCRLSDEMAKRLDSTGRTLRSIAKLTEDLLDIDQLQTGGLKLDLSQVSVRRIVDESIGLLQGLAEEKSVSLVISGSEQLSVRCDLQRAKQVVTNVLSNALKFAPAGSAVTVSWMEEAGLARISIEDNGPGVSPSVATSISSGSRVASETGGRGLGLKIARMLAEHMGGSVVLESTGSGAFARVSLPLA